MSSRQRIVAWDAGIRARWYRANELIGLSYPPLTIDLVEEVTEQNWRLVFETTQAYRVTTEECPWPFGITNLPEQGGGFFEVLDSEWIQALGKGEIRFLERSRHFIVCCYDDIVEAVAWGCRISKLDRIGYPDGHERIRIDPSRVYQGPPPQGEDAQSKLLRLRLASRDEG
jgi:hypothetical protein